MVLGRLLVNVWCIMAMFASRCEFALFVSLLYILARSIGVDSPFLSPVTVVAPNGLGSMFMVDGLVSRVDSILAGLSPNLSAIRLARFVCLSRKSTMHLGAAFPFATQMA